MKKLTIGLLTLLLSFGISFAQDDAAPEDGEKKEETGPWKLGGMGSVTYNQIGLFNWAAGGNSSMTLIGNMNLFANYKKNKLNWENNLDMAYGFIQQFKPNTIATKADGSRVTKAEDKLELNSKFGQKAWSDKFFYTAQLNARTQFAPGYANSNDSLYISKFLAPAYVQLAIGLDYKPNDWFSVFFSPVSGKMTIVTDTMLSAKESFGVNQRDDNGDFLPGNSRSLRMEFGATLTAKFKKDVMENIGVESNLNMFSNYIDRPENIDIRWNTAVVAKVNKFITVNLFTDLIYDHDIKVALYDSNGDPDLDPWGVQRKGPRIQFKEVFGVGISYKF